MKKGIVLGLMLGVFGLSGVDYNNIHMPKMH